MTLEGRLTAGKLKEILKDVPDDCDIVVVDPDWTIFNPSASSIELVAQVGYLKSDAEEHDAIGFTTINSRAMEDQIGIVDHMLFRLQEQPEDDISINIPLESSSEQATITDKGDPLSGPQMLFHS
jgi:hypothetical protein